MTTNDTARDLRTRPHRAFPRLPLPATKRARVFLLAVIAAFALLGALYSAAVPIFEASDELWHYPMVEVIARTWQLPVQPLEPGTSSGPWRQEGSQPPLYYALSAVLTAWVNTDDLPVVRQPNPHARAGEITPERDNVNLVIHDPETERFPWRGTVLAVHLVRLLSVALGAWSVYLTWALIREIVPTSEWIPILAAAIHAFTPMHLFISSSVNNDNLIIPLSTLALLLMVRSVKRAGEPFDRNEAWSTLGLGVVLALALLTKASGLALFPLAAAAIAWRTWRRPSYIPWGTRAAQMSLQVMAMLAPPLALSGWWFYRNLRLYADPMGFNAFYAVLGTRDIPADLGQLWAERFAFAAGYWGNFGGLNVPMPEPVYRALNTTALLALIGLGALFLRWLLGYSSTERAQDRAWLRRVWPFAWSNLTAARALAWVWPLGVLVSWSRWASITWSSQGRLVFSALPMWSAALALGLAAWHPRRLAFSAETGGGSRLRLVAPAALSGVLFLLCVVALPAWIVPAYRAPSATQQTADVLGLTPSNARFGDELELVGYALETPTATPGDQIGLTVMWRAITPTTSYRSTFIHVLGQGERIIAQRDTFPGHGLLPTTRLLPGQTWVEHHLLSIPAVAYAPDTLTVAVGVYETATGIRTPLASGADTARFGSLNLARPDGEGNGLGVRFGEGIVLDAYDISSVQPAPGEQVTISTTWICTGPIDGNYTISVQIIDDNWRKAGQSDAWPQEGHAPTSSWEVGARIVESRILTLDPGTQPGAYNVRIALYRAADDGTLVHLPVSQTRAGMPARDLTLTSLRITAP